MSRSPSPLRWLHSVDDKIKWRVSVLLFFASSFGRWWFSISFSEKCVWRDVSLLKQGVHIGSVNRIGHRACRTVFWWCLCVERIGNTPWGASFNKTEVFFALIDDCCMGWCRVAEHCVPGWLFAKQNLHKRHRRLMSLTRGERMVAECVAAVVAISAWQSGGKCREDEAMFWDDFIYDQELELMLLKLLSLGPVLVFLRRLHASSWWQDASVLPNPCWSLAKEAAWDSR